MADNKVKISHILDNLIPEFISTDNPLFVDFLKSYYISEEREYGSVYLIDHLSSFKNISTFADLVIGAKNPATGKPFVPIVLAEEIYEGDETINVNTTIGYPNSYGLIRIENEIITYTGKTATSFTGCVRGFSGVSAIETVGDQEFLTFSSTDSDDHPQGAALENLSFIYLQEFYRKHKRNFLPGFEERNFQNVSIENILSRAKDFFSSKGTDTSLQILFNVLFNSRVEIVKPFDFTISPSVAQWEKTQDVVVESISGDPKKLLATTVSQGSVTSPTASGAVSNVDEIFLGNKKYFKLGFSDGSIINKFNISKKTKVIGTTTSTSTVSVDSTIGFPESGSFYFNDGVEYVNITYTSKNHNQFLNCTGLISALPEGTEVSDAQFIFGFENADQRKLVQMRVVGSVSGLNSNASVTNSFDAGDSVTLKSFGEKYLDTNNRFNRWFYNNVSYLQVESVVALSNTLTTTAKNYLNLGDRVDILEKYTMTPIQENAQVIEVFSDRRFQISVGSLVEGVQYVVKKRLRYAASTLGVDSVLSGIQNSFSDTEDNCYVTFSGFPPYSSIVTTNRSVSFPGSAISGNTITVVNHNFIKGEQVHYTPASGTTGVEEGTYVVNRVDLNTIQLSLTPIALSVNDFISFSTVGSGTHTITPSVLHGKELKSQNNFKRILKNPKPSENNTKLLNSVGVALNGVEFLSPIGNEALYYGQVDSVEVTAGGENYDIINPPDITISDGVGTGVTAYGVFSGKIGSIVLTQSGFDFKSTPRVTLFGANTNGSVCEAKMRGYTHSVSVNDFALDLLNDRITSNTHKFLDGEEVTYLATGTPIGIGSTNVGFGTDRLSSGSSYFIARVDDNHFSLASTQENALAKTKLIDLLLFGNGDHTFKSRKVRKIIDRIEIVEEGNDISNRKVVIDSVKYPPEDPKDEYKSFVGINTQKNYIYAKHHGFSTGDVVTYECSGTKISGLTGDNDSLYYKVTVLDQNRFKISSAGITTYVVDTTKYDRNEYEYFHNLGSGTHTFKYPDIAVLIDGDVAIGQTTIVPSWYNANAFVESSGKVESVFIKNGGESFGSSDIVNFVKTPETKLLTGENADLRPIVDPTGKLISVTINDEGSNYTTPPDIVINGSGKFAEVKANILNGKLVSVDIVNGGRDYNENDTSISVVPNGSGARFLAKVHEWKVNNVERYSHLLDDIGNSTEFRDIVQIPANISAKGIKLGSYYPGRFYRSIFKDNLTATLEEKISGLSHSPIVGWAYDGNPIYGPYGDSNSLTQTGGIIRPQSSYKLDVETDSNLRPNKIDGYFSQDYVYVPGHGDLDEYNGRYIVNSDFPQGTYAYFSTIDDSTKKPTFPYITIKHKDATDQFNYDLLVDQSDSYLNTGDYKRMVTHYGINDPDRDYPFLSEYAKSQPNIRVSSVIGSNIDSIEIIDSGDNYKSGEKVVFDDKQIDVQIDAVLGKNITSVVTEELENKNITLRILDGNITAICTSPHNYQSGDIIEISGISTTGYKHIEGSYKIGVTSAVSTITTALGTTAQTGPVADLSLSDLPIKEKYSVEDVLVIGSEQLQIIAIDSINNLYKVSRNYNASAGSAHASGTAIHRLENQFTFNSTRRVSDLNVEYGLVEHFDPQKSVGIGSAYSSVVVGTAGSSNITESVPPKAIFIKNHKFNTGDKLSYVSYGGTIVASKNASLTPSFNLHDFNELHCVKVGRDYIGVSTERVGFTSNTVYFKSVSGVHHKFEKISDPVLANAKRTNGVVSVGESHGLFSGDIIDLSLTSGRTENTVLAYNEDFRVPVIDPVGFSTLAVSVGSTLSQITIEDHKFETGDVVLYTSSGNQMVGVVRNNVYYVIKDSNDTIRLANEKYQIEKFPVEYIQITGIFGATVTDHTLSKINPKIQAYSGSTVAIAASDSSMLNYDIEFYTDNKFESKYESKLITKVGTFGDGVVGTGVNISIGSSLPKRLYYKVVGKDTNYPNTFKDPVNIDVPNYSEIEVLESKFNGKHTIVGVGTTTITFNLPGIAETTSYQSTGITSAIYTTSSPRATGGIKSLKIFNFGKNVKTIPTFVSVGTTTGTGAILEVKSDKIGEILDTEVITSGIEIPEDKTLTPKADSHVLLKLKDVFTLDSVEVIDGGVNYNSTPKPILVGDSSVILSATNQGSSVLSVEVNAGGSGLSEASRVIPTLNSNGVEVKSASSTGILNTLSLRAPGTGFTTAFPFPFAIGDQIFVENISITDNGDGYNSSDYDYRNFTVTGINTNIGSESVTYSISGLGQTGGQFDSATSFGIVAKTENLASFKPVFKKVDYKVGESVSNLNDTASGVVEGWNPTTQLLKVKNVVGSFNTTDTLIGKLNNFKTKISSISKFDFDLQVDSTVENIRSWKDDVGKLNVDSQRIHDNDYYQRFSYSIKGTVPYETWSEPVNSLAHVSGYKNFADYEVSNAVPARVGMTTITSDLGFTVQLIPEASVHQRYYWDFASEETSNPNLSKIIKFDTKIITDYNESLTNKVLTIDDVSDQFTGFTTSTGGGIIGLSTFPLKNNGSPLLHHVVNPTTSIDANSIITVVGHNFNTGEALQYTPSTGRLGIVTTSVPGIGNTNLLPEKVFAIKDSENTFKVSVTQAGTAVTFSNKTGIGLTHAFEVDKDLALTRAIITIDNIIQSPIARKVVSVGLAAAVGIGSTEIFMNDISKIEGNSLLKSGDEIIKVSSVGIGSTNSVQVIRGAMGTVATAHTVGAGLSVVSGDYRISGGNIHFKDAPYGLTGIGTLGTRSSFAGRIFYRLNYDNNKIIDDISEQFDGSADKFDLTTDGTTLSGINTSFGAVLVNNIFQRPFYGEVGSILQSDYQIVGTGQTIDFTGSTSRDLPRGGVINEFTVGLGTGYQQPQAAVAAATVSGGGAITGVSIVGLGTGSGYLSPPRVSIADTLGVGAGASVTATISNGSITGFTVVQGGTGYTAASTVVSIDPPAPYKNLTLVGGNGSGAKLDVVVGTGGSITQFSMSDRGIGYEVNDVLSLSGLPFVGSGTTSNLQVTVRSRYQNKFSGWTFGQLQELDDFSSEFTGFRREFFLTRTTASGKEFYSVVAGDGSGVILQNNMLVFLNDVLQKPGIDYVFTGGTKFTFKDAPQPGSKFKLYFYVGSDGDFRQEDIDQTVKIGDQLRLQKYETVFEQDNRTIYQLLSADSVETEIYGGVGISTDTGFIRPVLWRKQTSDLIINGLPVSKVRNYLEPAIYPNTNIIASVGANDNKFYVKDAWSFDKIDDLGETLKDVRIVGLGTTVVTETFTGVTYAGDYGVITGIATANTGINTTSPMLVIDVAAHPNIFQSPAPSGSGKITRSGISAGDYFVLEKTIIGSGVTSIIEHVDSVVAVGNEFIDNVFYANQVVSIGSSSVRISANVKSVSGIVTAQLPANINDYGCFTWGSISTPNRNVGTGKSFEFFNQNGLSGIETSAYVRRTTQFRLSY